MPLFDLRCESGHIEQNEWRNRAPDDDRWGPCAVHAGCTAERHQYWGAPVRERKADAFVPVTIEGEHFATRSDFQRYLRGMRKSHPGCDIEVEGATRAGFRAEAEEVRHGLYKDQNIRNEREYNQRMYDAKRSSPGARR